MIAAPVSLRARGGFKPGAVSDLGALALGARERRGAWPERHRLHGADDERRVRGGVHVAELHLLAPHLMNGKSSLVVLLVMRVGLEPSAFIT